MTGNNAIHDELCRRADFSLRISEKISSIDKDLATIRQLKKLSANSVFDQSIFKSMSFEELAELTVKLATQLIDVRSILRDSRNILEDVEPLVPVESSTPQLISDISALKTQITEFVTTARDKPEPLDYSKIVSGLKELPTQKPVMNSKNQAREVADIQARSYNVMIYNCLRCSGDDSATEVAKTYFMTCGVRSIASIGERVVDADFVKTSEDGRTCSLRVKMDSPWVVNTILRDAKLLKEVNSELTGAWTDDDEAVYYYRDSFITKDRTAAEQEERRKLVSELRQKIASEPSKKWVIRFGKVEAVGDFIKSN